MFHVKHYKPCKPSILTVYTIKKRKCDNMNDYNIFNDDETMQYLLSANNDKTQSYYSSLFNRICDDVILHFDCDELKNIVNSECVYIELICGDNIDINVKLLFVSANQNIYMQVGEYYEQTDITQPQFNEYAIYLFIDNFIRHSLLTIQYIDNK